MLSLDSSKKNKWKKIIPLHVMGPDIYDIFPPKFGPIMAQALNVYFTLKYKRKYK